MEQLEYLGVYGINMVISANGKELIKKFEGYYSYAYLCQAGKLTIGWGNRYYKNGKEVGKFDKITLDEANELFDYYLKYFEKMVSQNVKVKLTQNQFDSLVSLCYNVGDAFKKSKGLSYLNKGDFEKAKHEFFDSKDGFVKIGKTINKDLVYRRKKELELFEKAV